MKSSLNRESKRYFIFAVTSSRSLTPIRSLDRFKSGLSCDDELYTVLLKRVELVLDVYEVILGKQKYIGGDVRCRRLILLGASY